jgi:hypothetical protein
VLCRGKTSDPRHRWVPEGTWYLPPGVAGRARWVAVASTAAAIAAAAAAAVATCWRSSITAGRLATVAATSIASLRSAEATATAEAASAASATTSSVAANVTGTTTATTTAASSASTTATTTKAGAFACNALQETRDLLIGLLEKVDKITDNTTVATVEESGGDTSVSGTSGTTNTMDVIVDVCRQIVVHNMRNVRHIQAALMEEKKSVKFIRKAVSTL